MLHQSIALAEQSNATGGVLVSILVAAVVLGYLAFIVTAFFGALFSSLSGGMKLVWAVFIWCAPFIGALCWYFIGKKNAPVRAT
jgi:hypothetical protein